MGSNKVNHSDKKKKNKPSDSNSHGGGPDAKIITDSRFASVHSDPRFQRAPKHKSKVEIDSRFKRMFTDKRFTSSSAPVDKRGKPKKQNSDNFLRNYYRIEENKGEVEKEGQTEDDDEEEEEESKGQELVKLGGDESETEPSGESDASESEEDDVESWESGSSIDTDEDEDEAFDVEYEPEEPEEHVPEIEKETHRLAVVNMDWRHVKAVDLFMMLSSFLPKDGHMVSVTVYPSDFGIQRMKEEETHGPVALFDDENEKNGNDDDADNDDDNDDEIDNEKLRAYEKSRLRYYFAVVECDSVATADYLYKACDGVEFERSSNVLDLRFIPDSMEFKHPPRDVATEAPANYVGLNFQTKALQLSNINLSWDEDEPDRVKTLKRKFDADQLAELELKEFLASDDSESEEEAEDGEAEVKSDKKQKKRDLYRALLESGNGSDGDEEEDDQDMELTFNTGLEDISKRILEKKDKKQETVWETKLREQREKKKLRKHRSKNSSEDESSDTDQEAIDEPGDFFVEEPSDEEEPKKSKGKSKKRKKQEDTNRQAEATKDELELLLADDTMGGTGAKGYNLKRRKGKDGKKIKLTLEEDKIPPIVEDPRFSSLFSSPAFALDPTDPRFERSSATYARLVSQQKQKAREEELLAPVEPQAITDEQVKSDAAGSSKKEKDELSVLVKMVKTKSKQVKLPSNEKSGKKDKNLQSNDKDQRKKKKHKKEKHELSTSVESVKKGKTKAQKKSK
ncbi:pre-rRNA-processing protein ESF1 [Humulus lupulus]|uniref:pre-rRNA-processing protein ESF1 n=1 Tax=Humulus lupulus TaxID=3486 RepID=UPI002B4014E9|nr:pre-rRNA-processing protein ESF1 [Humulus lupulus]